MNIDSDFPIMTNTLPDFPNPNFKKPNIQLQKNQISSTT